MARTSAPLSICSIVQETNPRHFSGWTDEELAALARGAGPIAEVLAAKLRKAGFLVQEIHCIVHDRDKCEVWDESLKRYAVRQEAPHFHAAVKFAANPGTGKAAGGTLTQVARAAGVEERCVEKARKGRYEWDRMLSCLIRVRCGDKEYYDPEEVCSTGLVVDGIPQYKPYGEIFKERRKAWEDSRDKAEERQEAMTVELLEEKILTGEVKRSQVLLTDAFFSIYARNKRRMDDAFDTYAERRTAKTIQAMVNGNCEVSVIYVTGKDHSGRSVFTEGLVRTIQEDARKRLGEDWEECVCASANPFDEYRGEEILLLDDPRGSSLSTSDWLRLLDPDRRLLGAGRYRGRRMACRVIIICSEKDILNYFFFAPGRGDVNEAMDRFFRGITVRARLYRGSDEPDACRLLVGEMRETEPFQETEPGSASRQLTLHHDFRKDEQDMSWSDALRRLADLTMERNGAGGKDAGLSGNVRPGEQEAPENDAPGKDHEERQGRDEAFMEAEDERYEAEIDEVLRLYEMRKARDES